MAENAPKTDLNTGIKRVRRLEVEVKGEPLHQSTDTKACQPPAHRRRVDLVLGFQWELPCCHC